MRGDSDERPGSELREGRGEEGRGGARRGALELGGHVVLAWLCGVAVLRRCVSKAQAQAQIQRASAVEGGWLPVEVLPVQASSPPRSTLHAPWQSRV